MTQSAISFGNTVLPLAILALIATALPYALTPKDTRSHARVAVSIGATALAMTGVSALFVALFDARELPAGGLPGTMLIIWYYLRSALGAALFWGPVLAIVWLSLAQRVERLRGKDIASGN